MWLCLLFLPSWQTILTADMSSSQRGSVSMRLVQTWQRKSNERGRRQHWSGKEKARCCCLCLRCFQELLGIEESGDRELRGQIHFKPLGVIESGNRRRTVTQGTDILARDDLKGVFSLIGPSNQWPLCTYCLFFTCGTPQRFRYCENATMLKL